MMTEAGFLPPFASSRTDFVDFRTFKRNVIEVYSYIGDLITQKIKKNRPN